jgi:membrane peptidoglycan carboxypeptidase
VKSLLMLKGRAVKDRYTKSTTRTVVRRLAAVTACALALQTFLFALVYDAALEHVRRHDPRQLQNRSEVCFYYAPPTVRAGAVLSLDELVSYLRELGYEERADGAPGSFSLADNRLEFSPRSTNFQPAAITFARERVSRITSGAGELEQIEIEPQPMQNFVSYLGDESLAGQRVRRTVVAAGLVPALLADAVTSAEDRRFFSHHGIDVFGIAHRLLTRAGGGSSITQQLDKNTIYEGAKDEFWESYLGFLPRSWQRKVTDVFLSLATERLLSKDQILAAYLSVVPLGAVEGVELQGAEAAAREYFGKGLPELSLAQSATLAGMIHRPSFYLAKAREGDYDDLLARRNHVLDLMQRNHPEKYSADEIARAKVEALQFVFASSRRAERPAETYSRQFVELAARRLPQELAELQASEGSSQVLTTLDFDLQKEGTEIVESAAQRLQAQVARVCLREKIVKVDCANLKPQIALVALDARMGAVLALVGGAGSQFNFATARRSPGSAIKPFVYLRAIESGTWQGQPFTAATIIDPAKDSLAGYRPDEHAGERATARVGVARSYNFHAVAAAEAAGLQPTIDFIKRVTDSQPGLTGMAAIGGAAGSETSLLSLTQAYTIFPNGGRLFHASFHQSFIYDGVRKELAQAQAEKVADAGAAFIVTEMLEDVLKPRGTAPKFRQSAGLNDVTLAAKTGTGMVADLTFVVFTPRLVVGVWCGLPQNEIKLKLEDGFIGGRVAAPVAAAFMRSVRRHHAELLAGEFARPANVTKIRINSRKNCAAANGDREEYFVNGREPSPCSR